MEIPSHIKPEQTYKPRVSLAFFFLLSCHPHHCSSSTNFLRSFQSNGFSGEDAAHCFLETFGPLYSTLQRTLNYPTVPFHYFSDQVGGFLCVRAVDARVEQQEGYADRKRRTARLLDQKRSGRMQAPVQAWRVCWVFFFQGQETRGSKTPVRRITHPEAAYVRQPEAACQAMDALLSLL